jgi:sugar lactone lactonase YvrE
MQDSPRGCLWEDKFLFSFVFNSESNEHVFIDVQGSEMVDYVPKGIKSISAHPYLPQFAIINTDGCLQVVF